MQTITSIVVAILGFVSFVAACAAPENRDSDIGDFYAATFLNDVSGVVLFYADNVYVTVAVALLTQASSKNHFTYRIQDSEPFGLCDPRNQVFNPYCGDFSARTAAEKEVGDLSGKHGDLTKDFVFDIYDDLYLTLNVNNKAFIGKKSLVIEDSHGKRVACVEIKRVVDKFTGEDAKAAKPALKMNIPQFVKKLIA